MSYSVFNHDWCGMNECNHLIIFVDDAIVMRLITEVICVDSNAQPFGQKGHGRYDDMYTETLMQLIIS